MKKIALLALTALLLNSCSKGGRNDATPTTPTPTSVTISGTDYPIIKIGNKTWTTVNYNGPGGDNYASTATNDAQYGKLYFLSEAKAIALPTGWRLPTQDDFNDLMKNVGTTTNDSQGNLTIDGVGNKKLRSLLGWQYSVGDNSSGFNAYATGSNVLTGATPTSKGYSGKGGYTVFWSSTAGPTSTNNQMAFEIYNEVYSATIHDDYAMVYPQPSASSFQYSIRFVKDN